MESAPTQKYHRRSIRLPHYDYARAGYYFITITAQNREHLFGQIHDGVMVLNVAGEMVQRLWYEITNEFSNVALHDFVIMPNHIHGIIEIKHHNTVGVPLVGTFIMWMANTHKGQTHGSAPTLTCLYFELKYKEN